MRFQGGERWLLVGVVRLAKHLDQADQLRCLGGLGGVGLATDRDPQRGEREEATTSAQSAAFGGGPIWMRSPTNAPTSVKSTPRADIRTYMNAGIVLTVWPV